MDTPYDETISSFCAFLTHCNCMVFAGEFFADVTLCGNFCDFTFSLLVAFTLYNAGLACAALAGVSFVSLLQWCCRGGSDL